MRGMLKLEAEADSEYISEYHHKLRGCIWNRLSESLQDTLHGNDTVPTFAFSNPFPVGRISEGDTRRVIVASHHDEVVSDLCSRLGTGDEFNIGEMEFSVSSAEPFAISVGEPGDTGTLRTDTGVYVPVQSERFDELGISGEGFDGDEIAWTTDHPLGAFLTRVRENLQRKHNAVFDEYLNAPDENTQLFTSVSNTKEYAVTVPVSSSNGYEWTFVVSKWEFDYTVRDDDHRRWLDLLLNTGIGARNALGFGFVNPVSN